MLKLGAGYVNGLLDSVVEYGPQTCNNLTLEQAIANIRKDLPNGGPLVLSSSWEDLDAFHVKQSK